MDARESYDDFRIPSNIICSLDLWHLFSLFFLTTFENSIVIISFDISIFDRVSSHVTRNFFEVMRSRMSKNVTKNRQIFIDPNDFSRLAISCHKNQGFEIALGSFQPATRHR